MQQGAKIHCRTQHKQQHLNSSAGRCSDQSVRQPSRRHALSGIRDPQGDDSPYSMLSTPGEPVIFVDLPGKGGGRIVYSLVSEGSSGKQTMNMLTYASPIALRPQRKYALGLYVQSLTYQNMKETGKGVLQVLRQHHAPLFHLLGKTSGRDVDKIAELQKLGADLQEEYGLPTIADACSIMELKVASDFIPAGDHEVVICDVVDWKKLEILADGSVLQQRPLYTGYLRREGYL